MKDDQHVILQRIAAKLKELNIKAAQALEVLRTLIKENAWVKDKPGGIITLLPRYAGGVA